MNACCKFAARPGNKLITLFHELFAEGPIWKSEFWLSRVQIHLASKLHRFSHGSVTSTLRYASKLLQWDDGKSVSVLPVFSNIGEPRMLLPLAWRKRRAVVFGRRESRNQVYAGNLQRIAELCRCLRIDEIHDIGPRLGMNRSHIGHARLHELGELPAAQVSEILRHSVAGIFDYATDLWSKSGIFAAYCSHGVIPVCMRPPGNDGGITPEMYWLAGDGRIDNDNDRRAAKIAEEATRWYRTHTRQVCAERVAGLLA